MTPYKYYIFLTSKEKQALRELKKAGKTERRLADRARIILWTNKRLSIAAIAARLECHRSSGHQLATLVSATTCQRTIGYRLFARCARSGRPVTRTPLQEAQIKAIVCERPALLKKP